MAYWWHYDPGTGWYRHDTKAAAMRNVKEDFELHKGYANSDGWAEDIESMSVWKTKTAKPEDEYDDWIEKNGVKIAQAVVSFEDVRPEPPADLKGLALEEWKLDNWPVDWEYERVVDYEIREI